jgi:hypothetical protein
MSSKPVVPRIGPYVFFFYSLENNEPPHIHVRRERKKARFWLEPVELYSSAGFPAHELNRISKLVEENRRLLLEAWNDYFVI